MCNTMNYKETAPEPLDNTQLETLRSDADSCVEVKKCLEIISLHPFHLSNLTNSIKEILHERIAKYSVALDGILLGYSNIKTLGSKAPVYDDMFNMFQKIEADVYVFKPTLECTLNGIVNKKFQNDIGCLVHKVFNVSLPKSVDVDNWLGFRAQIGQEVQFKVTFMQLNAELPYIRGELLSIISEDSGISTSDEVAAPKKKKAKKFKEGNADNDPELETESQKKKKHKKKKKLPESGETKVEEVILHKKKPKKEKKEKKSMSKQHDNVDGDYEPQEEPEAIGTNELVEHLLDQKKKKEKLKKKPTNDCAPVDAMKETENKNNKKDKKVKKGMKEKKGKIKTKTEKNETSMLDETLPDLNLDVLFDSMCKGSDNELLAFSQNIVLPADSDMEEVLKDIPKKDKKVKKEKSSKNKEGLKSIPKQGKKDKKEKSPKNRKFENIEDESVIVGEKKSKKGKKENKVKRESLEKSPNKRKMDNVDQENVTTDGKEVLKDISKQKKQEKKAKAGSPEKASKKRKLEDDAAVSKKKRKRTSI